MSDAAANADQIKFWNGVTGEKWAQHQSDMDRNLTDATKGVIALAAAIALFRFKRGVIEVIGLCGYYTMVSMTLNTFQFGLPEGEVSELV